MINKIQERALTIVYIDNISSLSNLLKKSGSISIHHKNLQALAIEILNVWIIQIKRNKIRLPCTGFH